MRFAKTFCKANAVISAVPAGLPVKLQYNEHGLLQTFRIGFTPNLDPMYEQPGLKFDRDKLFSKIKGFVPNAISTKGGTTWVYGLLYSDNVPLDEGEMPKALFQSYIEDILKGGRYEFYAGYAKSLAVQFNGSLIIRNFLSGAKFNLLPQVVVPVVMKEETLNMLMDPASYPFNRNFVAGYFIYEGLNCRYAADTLIQIKVTNEPKLFIGSDGYWKATVVSEKKEAFTFNYSSILHNNIKKGTVLLAERDANSNVLTVITTRIKGGAQVVQNSSPISVKCPTCGKINMIGTSNAPTHCDDPHCMSHQFLNVVKMLKVFGLPEMSFEDYSEAVKSKEVMCLTDILALPQYNKIKIKSTLAKALYAITPSTEVPNSEIFERFANKCNNNAETVMYYVANPLHIETDLDIVDPVVNKFATWLQDPYNVTTIQTILDVVEIEARSKKFEGDPIFRGNSFILTGRFKRGDYYEIASILESYSAHVSPSFEQGEKLPSAVIQGSLNEGISGKVIQKARLHSIPIIDEDEFFTRYEIDADLEKNLL